MSPTATMTAETGTTPPELTPERFVETLWGIRVGQSSPRPQPTTVPHTFEGGAAEWLYRIWGLASPGSPTPSR